MAGKSSVFRFADVEVREREFSLTKAGEVLPVEPKAFRVLLILLRNPQKLIAKEELLNAVWGDAAVTENSLTRCIALLRRVLGDDTHNPRYIETVATVGYRFLCRVEATEDGFCTLATTEEGRTPGEGFASRATETAMSGRTRKSLPAIVSIAAVPLLLFVGFILWRNLLRLPRVSNVVKLTNDAKTKVSFNLPVTDGVHLYFVEGDPNAGGSRIAQVSAAGGETSQLQTSLREISRIYDIAPDSSELLVGNGIGLPPDTATGRAGGALEVWIQPLPGGTPHRVGNIYATSASYAPNGMQILYADGRSLITINRDGSNPRELAKASGFVGGLRYSPDGKRARFDIADGPFRNGSLWEIEANGDNLHQLLPKWKESLNQCFGNWSPDGNYYFFQAGLGNDQAIWAMPEHRFILSGGSGSPSRLISGPLHLSTPVPSRKGKKLFVIGEELRVEPVRYDSKTHRFESYLNGASISSFEISRDRKWIAYVSYPDMNLWRSRVDGTERMQLTFAPVRAYGPRWSPDGSRIAFTNVQFNRPWSVSLVSSSGGPPESLPTASLGETDPNWLPDGRSIIYGLFQPADKGTFAILRQDLDTGKISRIPDSVGRYSPRVSPDERYVSAFSLSSKELLLYDLKTTRWSTLAKGEAFSYNLWSADGKYVYVRDLYDGSPRIVRVRIRDAEMVEVVSLKDLPQVVDTFAFWIGLTPEGDPVVIRDRSTQEIYALDLH